MPNLFIEVLEEDIDAKIKAMESYEFEKREWPHPRSPEALRVAVKRTGIVVGVGYSEAFQIVRSID